MQKLACFTFIFLFTSMLVSCASPSSIPTPTTAIDMIEPGDKVGDFQITTGKVEEVKFLYELDSSETPKDAGTDEVAWGTKVVASVGVYDDQYSGKLDEVWSTLSYDLYINERPVNLSVFGTIEKKNPMVGTMRHYNVVIEALKPGKITIHGVGKVNDEAFEYIETLIFLPPEQDEIK